jgi:hypothetical protein
MHDRYTYESCEVGETKARVLCVEVKSARRANMHTIGFTIAAELTRYANPKIVNAAWRFMSISDH